VPPDTFDARGGHVFLIEMVGANAECVGAMTAALDRELARLNADYRAHRHGGFGLREPRVRILPPGSFATWMRARGKLGGQNKVPRVISDPRLLEELCELAGDRK
jgi:hypothetical protein